MRHGYWWIQLLLGVVLIVAPVAERFTKVHPAAYTDLGVGAVIVVWALIGYWLMGGMPPERRHRTHA